MRKPPPTRALLSPCPLTRPPQFLPRTRPRACKELGFPSNMSEPSPNHGGSWLNGTVLGIALTSLASDWSHEMATAVLPALLISLGAGPGWLGAIEGAADGLSSFTKLAAGHWTDRLDPRKP